MSLRAASGGICGCTELLWERVQLLVEDWACTEFRNSCGRRGESWLPSAENLRSAVAEICSLL